MRSISHGFLSGGRLCDGNPGAVIKLCWDRLFFALSFFFASVRSRDGVRHVSNPIFLKKIARGLPLHEIRVEMRWVSLATCCRLNCAQLLRRNVFGAMINRSFGRQCL